MSLKSWNKRTTRQWRRVFTLYSTSVKGTCVKVLKTASCVTRKQRVEIPASSEFILQFSPQQLADVVRILDHHVRGPQSLWNDIDDLQRSAMLSSNCGGLIDGGMGIQSSARSNPDRASLVH